MYAACAVYAMYAVHVLKVVHAACAVYAVDAMHTGNAVYALYCIICSAYAMCTPNCSYQMNENIFSLIEQMKAFPSFPGAIPG